MHGIPTVFLLGTLSVVNLLHQGIATKFASSCSPSLLPSAESMPPLKRKRGDKGPAHNPLRDKELLVAASRAQAAVLSSRPGEKATTAIEFCREVLREQLGLRDFAIGQWERMVISSARKEALGEKDSIFIVKPPTATAVHLPSLAECAHALNDGIASSGSSTGATSHAKTASDLRARLSAGLDPVALQTKGALLIPSVFGAKQVSAIAAKLAEENICGAEIRLRASTGNGIGGAYQPIQLSAVPELSELSKMLAEVICERLNTPECGSKALALRYAEGGVNWAHQDQSACPFQALLLLSRPAIDFTGGQFYVTDAVAARAGGRDAVCQIEWQGNGDVIVFAANGNGSERAWYHGMREVTRGADRCQRLAVGLLQT